MNTRTGRKIMNNFRIISTVMAMACSISAVAEFKKPPQPQNVPELMRGVNGKTIATAADWEKIRRPEVVEILQKQEYGVRPIERPDDLAFAETAASEECYGGKALRKRIKATYSGPGGKGEMNFSVWIPKSTLPLNPLKDIPSINKYRGTLLLLRFLHRFF
jgi:hypothetical protein